MRLKISRKAASFVCAAIVLAGLVTAASASQRGTSANAKSLFALDGDGSAKSDDGLRGWLVYQGAD